MSAIMSLAVLYVTSLPITTCLLNHFLKLSTMHTSLSLYSVMNCGSSLHVVYHRKLVKSMHINKFAEILLKSRKQKGFSQSELAKKSGFTKRAIQYWEKGKKSISLENADRLLTALGVEIKIGKTESR